MKLKISDFEVHKILPKTMDYPSIALFLILREKETNENILIINTHLIYKEQRGDMKLGMIILILKSIHKILSAYKISDIFFSGDFNMIPNSMLYKFLSTGEIDLEADLEEYSNQSALKNHEQFHSIKEFIAAGDLKFKRRTGFSEKNVLDQSFLRALVQIQVELPDFLSNKQEILVSENFLSILKIDEQSDSLESLSKLLFFKSSYAEFKTQYQKIYKMNKNKLRKLHFYLNSEFYNNEAFATQFTHDMKNTVDYIWFSACGNYKIARVLQLPDPIELYALKTTLPHDVEGSDHFPIVADFVFDKKKLIF